MKTIKESLLLWVRFSCTLTNTVFVLMMAFVVFLTHTGPPHAITRLHLVQKGMDKECVFRVLGKPQKTFNSQVVYRRFLSPGFMSIYFDEDDKYTGEWHYEPY